MSTEINRKRISDFPEGVAENVELFARTANGTNVRVRYDVKQSIGRSTTSVMSQAAVASELAKRDEAIENLKVGAIGVITSPDDSISVDSVEGGVSIGVNASKVVDHKRGLSVVGNLIGVAIDPNEGNRLIMTATGLLRVESENYWEQFN
ncbi:MAG: hypothetical protein J6U49_07520 [Alistipes sp.]|nr:hypothetical protein [Alistipes sp.]